MSGNIDRAWTKLGRSMRFSVLTAATVALWFGMLHPALDNTPIFGQVRGGTADWLATREAIIGENSYAPIADLANKYLGWADVEPDYPHPRPPSALLVLLPFAAVSPNLIIIAMMMISAVALVYWVQSCVLWVGARPASELLVVPFVVTDPVIQGVVWGSHIPLVAAALGAAMTLSVARSNPWVRGLFIGIASGFKLFPGAVALAFRNRRLATIIGAGLSLAALTAGGLLLPGVGVGSAFSAMGDASTNFEGSQINMSVAYNLGGSLGVTIAVGLTGLIAIVSASKMWDPVRVIPAALIVMILISPLAWPEYLVLAFPALLALTVSAMRTRLLAVLAWTVMVLTTDGTVLLLLCIAIVLALALPEVGKRLGESRDEAERLLAS